MPKLILLSALLFLSPSSYAESWFDSAQEFFGFGDDETTEAPAPAAPESTASAITDAAIQAVTSSSTAASLTDMVESQLGVTKAQAQGGLGTIFGLVQANLGEADFATLSQSVPDMGNLLSAAPAVSESTKGLTSLMGNAGKYAQALQSTTKAYSQFEELGLGVDQIPNYINVTNEFLQSQGSPNAFNLFQQGVNTLLTAEQ